MSSFECCLLDGPIEDSAVVRCLDCTRKFHVKCLNATEAPPNYRCPTCTRKIRRSSALPAQSGPSVSPFGGGPSPGSSISRAESNISKQIEMVDAEMSHQIEQLELDAARQALKRQQAILQIKEKAHAAKGSIIDKARSEQAAASVRSVAVHNEDRVRMWVSESGPPSSAPKNELWDRVERLDSRPQANAAVNETTNDVPLSSVAVRNPIDAARVNFAVKNPFEETALVSRGRSTDIYGHNQITRPRTETADRTAAQSRVLEVSTLATSGSLPLLEDLVTDKEDLSMRRQQMAKESHKYPKLPKFDGTSGWIDFVVFLVETTRDYAIPQRENAVRLRESLSGEARGLVDGLLCTAGVPAAVKYLRMRYGGPEKVLQTLENRCAELKPVQDKAGDLVMFMSEVEKLRVSIKSYGQIYRMENHGLVAKLFAKLPHTFHHSWALCKGASAKETPNLDEFLDWLESIVSRLPQTASTPAHRDSAPVVDVADFDYHNSGDEDTQEPLKMCLAGCGSSHHLSSCHAFLRMNGHERLWLTKAHGICWSCLYCHKGHECLDPVQCDCRRYHHPLMHGALSKMLGSPPPTLPQQTQQ